MSDGRGPTVSDVGEDALLGRIAARIGPLAGIGDDAATIAAPGAQILITTDVMVEGPDIDVSYMSGFDIGWKAVTVNASDIAAMGGRPTHAVATVTLRPDVAVRTFDDLLEGMLASVDRYGVALVGGDLSGGGEIAVGICMLGIPVGEGPVLRSGARPGDAVCVTGALGGARAGLEVLRRGRRSAATEALAVRLLRPEARVRAGAALAGPGLPTAMIDISDGFAVDLDRLLRASNVGARIDLEALPIEAGIDDVGLDPVETAVLGGEDFELLFTIAERDLERARAALEVTATSMAHVGTVHGGPATIGGTPLQRWKERGWQHLRNP